MYCLKYIIIVKANFKEYLQNFNTNLLHNTFYYWLFSHMFRPDSLAIFRESSMT